MSTVARMMLCVSAIALLAGCSSMLSENPTLTPQTQTSIALNHLPPPSEKLYAAVFSFQDESGQHKPNTSFAEYSLAVTQGGASILVDALTEAGDRQWFTVVERTRLPAMLQERQLIRANRIDHVGPDGKPLPGLPALHNAGLIMEGASSVMTPIR
jgi:curli production assembly/transport component CsgG